MNIKNPRYIAPTGLLLNSSALLISTLLGFGGFSVKAFSGYVIANYVSNLLMVFLFLVGLGLIFSAVGYANQLKNRKIKNFNLILFSYLAVGFVFFAISFFGFASPHRNANFWGETTFVEIQDTLFFNNLTLTCFLTLGTQQVLLSIIFFKTKMFQQHQLSKAAVTLTLTSGIFLIIKTIIDFPPIKELIFVLSYKLKLPFPNNILSIATVVIYMSAQIPIIMILLHNERFSTDH